MAAIQEQFSAFPLAANATQTLVPASLSPPSAQVGGFLCSTSGTAKIGQGVTGAGADIVTPFAVTAGVFYPIPATVGVTSAFVLTGGASGTLFAVLGA